MLRSVNEPDTIEPAPASARVAPRPVPLKPLFENVTESATACLLTMVQGNPLALTLTHWAVASQTGLISGSIATAALFLARKRQRLAVAVVLALTTMLVDYFSHPSHFGALFAEAIVTGLAAGALSLIVGRIIASMRARSVALKQKSPIRR